MVYNGVDKSRDGHSASESNVTAYVQFLGDTSNSSSTANLSNSGDYRVVNTSLSDMTGDIAFAGYTSDERTTLVSCWFTVQALGCGETELRFARINMSTGRCVHYKLRITSPIDDFESTTRNCIANTLSPSHARNSVDLLSYTTTLTAITRDLTIVPRRCHHNCTTKFRAS